MKLYRTEMGIRVEIIVSRRHVRFAISGFTISSSSGSGSSSSSRLFSNFLVSHFFVKSKKWDLCACERTSKMRSSSPVQLPMAYRQLLLLARMEAPPPPPKSDSEPAEKGQSSPPLVRFGCFALLNVLLMLTVFLLCQSGFAKKATDKNGIYFYKIMRV